MRLAYKAAAALSLAAASAFAAIDISTGRDCQAAFCADEPTISKCVLCCGTYCPGLWLTDCQNACFGGVDAQPKVIHELALASDSLAAGGMSPAETAAAVDFIVFVATGAQNEYLRQRAVMIGLETPIVSGILKHNEQGGLRHNEQGGLRSDKGAGSKFPELI